MQVPTMAREIGQKAKEMIGPLLYNGEPIRPGT
jgi:hypothetical protein